MRELGLSSPNSFSLIEETSGVDLIFSHPDEQIAPEKKKQMVSHKHTNSSLTDNSPYLSVVILRLQRVNS